MKIQEFRAESASEALRKVRDALGPAALVLSTRADETGGGVLVAAALPAAGERRRPERSAERPVAATLREMQSELAELRETLLEGKGPSFALPPGLADLETRLRENGLPSLLRRRVVEATARRASGVEAFAAAAELLAEIVPIWPSKGFERRPRALAFVGPTGAGKTTTLAKLAGRLVHEAKKRVALLTFDTYRVAAVEQIRAYADMLAVPLEVLFTPADAARALAAHKDRDVILIDTAGRSPFDRARIQELAGLLGAGGEIETFLVLSASTSADVAAETLDRFEPAQPSALVLTKLDEIRKPGSLLQLVVERDLPLAYLAAGQEVPADLERATGEKVAAALLAPPRDAAVEPLGGEL